jgi:hypothetical protein
MLKSCPLLASYHVPRSIIFQTYIAAIFNQITAAIAVLQFDFVNFGLATRCTTHQSAAAASSVER